MRNRHNIVGSEVGRPRRLYLDRMVKFGTKRAGSQLLTRRFKVGFFYASVLHRL